MNRNSLLLKTMLPVAIGLAVVVWLFAREFNIEDFRRIEWTSNAVWFIIVAWICMAGRETGLAWRFRVLSDRRLSWRQAVKITMLCEFTSAITPTTAGGSALSMVFIQREGLTVGHATTLTMCTLLLDEAFFVVACPLIFILVPASELFAFDASSLANGIRVAFWIVYALIVLITFLLFAGLFVRPEAVAGIIKGVFKLKPLRRWAAKANEAAENMLTASRDIRHRPARWWAEASAATIFSWTSRYLVVNALFAAFASAAPQMLVFARQFVVWTLLTVSPTPGGSGVSEWLFTTYYGDLLPDPSVALVIAIAWRIITYYVYLGVGAFMVPAWLKQSFKKHNH